MSVNHHSDGERIFLLTELGDEPSPLPRMISGQKPFSIELIQLQSGKGEKLPFPTLRSLLATAILLSFYGRYTEVKHMLSQLSQRAR